MNQKKWNIFISEKTLVRPRANVSIDQMIKIIGTVDGDNNFSAIEIRPWMGQNMMNGSGQSCNAVKNGCPMMRN